MKRRFLNIIFVLTIIVFSVTGVSAAGLSVTAGSKSVVVGNTVKVTVNANGIAGKFSVKSSNSDVLSGGTSSEWLENQSKTYTFSAKKIGSTTIVVTPINAAYSDGSGKVTGSKSITINVVKPREKSTNNNLSKLEVEGYKLSPDFNKDTLEYTVNIESNIESIKINAKTEDNYATVVGNGTKEIDEGSNKFDIKVTSETGKEKVYTLNVVVKDTNPIVKTIDNKEYNVVKRAKSLTLPDGLNKDLFKLSTIKLDDVEIPAYVSEELELTLIGLKDKDGNIYLFKVVNNSITEKYEIFNSNKITVIFSEPKEVLTGYSKTTVLVNSKEYTAYKNDNTILIYGTNVETNESNWYKVDEKEGTIQLYDNSLVDKLNAKEKEFNDTLSQYKMVILGVTALSLILLIIIIILSITKTKKKKVVTKPVIKQDVKVENKETVKEAEKEEIATKVEEKQESKSKNKNKKQKEEVALEIDKTLEELEKEQNLDETGEIIPSIEEIEEDLKDTKNENTDSNKEDDELVSVEEFFDLKKKNKKKK